MTKPKPRRHQPSRRAGELPDVPIPRHGDDVTHTDASRPHPAPRLTSELISDLPATGPTDPIHYYRKPYVGWLFRQRINRGLSLLPARRFDRVLEVGFGAGAVLRALAPVARELHAIDLDADPKLVGAQLQRDGVAAQLVQGNVLALPYPDAHFELAVSFSVFEHLHEYERALREVHRVLRPGGLFLLGMPSVNRLMEAGFAAIGFKNIDHHHVTTPAQVRGAFGATAFRALRTAHLDFPGPRPFGLRLYYNTLLEKA